MKYTMEDPTIEAQPHVTTAVFDLGVAPYQPVQDLQVRLRRAVAAGAIPGILLLLEHEPVITLGRRGLLTDIHSPHEAALRGVEIVQSERGGQNTLHAPGQLVTYLIIPIPRRDLRRFVFHLEEILRRLLLGVGLAAIRIQGRPGLYLHGAKVASVGLRCEHGVASHGTSLNVAPDLSLFELVTSCGDPETRPTSMREALGREVNMDQVKRGYVSAFREVFGTATSPLRALPYNLVEVALGMPPASPEHGLA